MAGASQEGPEGVDLILATVPLIEQDASDTAVGACSGVIVDDGRRRALLTVQHAVGNSGRWSVIDHSDGRTGSRVYQLGAMQYLARWSLGRQGTTIVDLAFTAVPRAFEPRFQQIEARTGQIVVDEPRYVFALSAIVRPIATATYGFAGTIKTNPVAGGPELFADLRVEQCLQFTGEDENWYYFDLGHARGDDIEYRGTSGAPILSREGDLVGLVAGPGHSSSSIRAVPLDRYLMAISVGLREDASTATP